MWLFILFLVIILLVTLCAANHYGLYQSGLGKKLCDVMCLSHPVSGALEDFEGGVEDLKEGEEVEQLPVY